jgi:hypothetical protein
LLKRCLAIILVVIWVAVCVEAISLHSINPHSATRAPLSHKIHVSVAQIEFNQSKQSVEIVIRVFSDDLENALSQYSKRQVKIDPATASRDRRVGEMVMAYLRERFELRSKSGRPVKLNWIGLEGQMDMFWLYAAGRLPGGLEGTQLRNKIFCELFDDQVNIVNAKHQGKQLGLIFEPKDDFKNLTTRASAK